MGYYIYIIASILILPVMIYSIIIQSKVTSTFKTYNSVDSQIGKAANQIAREMLDSAGLYDVTIKKIKGNLTDNYNPKNKTLSLSESTYDSTSVAAIGVAAHEVGHAFQHAKGYYPIKIRSSLVPIVNICSGLAIPLLIVGIVLSSLSIIAPNVGEILIWIAVAFYASSTIFHLVTVPVEFNASNRALASLTSLGILTPEEQPMAKKVLDAAAKTYLAALFTSAIYFLRFLGYILIMFGNNKD